MSKLPSRQDILDWVRDNPAKGSRRDIGRAFAIKGAARIELKRMLREMARDGLLEKRTHRSDDPNALPPVGVLRVLAPDTQGDLFAEPTQWQGERPVPRIPIVGKRTGHEPGEGDRILARLTPTPQGEYGHEARIIRRIGTGARRILGLYRKGTEGGRIKSIDKGAGREWRVAEADRLGASDGDLVEAEQSGPKSRLGLPWARITEVLGDPMAPKSVSLFAIHAHGIPDAFPDTVLAEAEAVMSAGTGERVDLSHLAFITIDPADARDHDDAVFAEPDEDAKNAGGFVVWVAIADVACHVRPGSELDREARKRGNSTYFPDRVVPMLPERLSADLCSLHEGVERPVIALRMVFDNQGRKIAHRFLRAMIRSRASLTYRQVQTAADGEPDAQTAPLLGDVINPLFLVYTALAKARDARAPLHLDLPERRIELSDDGHVTSVAFRERLKAHRLIEEFMVQANVAAAETLKAKRHAFLYRVHEEPAPEKLDALREVAVAAGLTLAKGQVLKTAHLNRLLDAAAGSENAEIINMSVLRSMTQAYYAPENLGHFGLALKSYAHFTSPIRRYADVIVHRALISAHGWGEEGLSNDDIEEMAQTGDAISAIERRSMLAERDTNDRYLAAYLSERVGNEFEGRISGIARFGLFVRLDETGADGLVPISTLGREFFRHDAQTQTLTGEKSRLVLRPGMPVTVRLAEAAPITGGLMFELLTQNGKAIPRSGGGRGGGSRKLNAYRRKKQKIRTRARRG